MKGKFKKNRIKEVIASALGLLVVIALVAFVDNKAAVQRCEELQIELLEADKQFYISEADIRRHITNNGHNPLKGKLLKDIDLGDLEERVKQIKQIEFCEAYADLRGNIRVKVKPYVPFARVIAANGIDMYVDLHGQYFPLSKYHTTRVTVLSGGYFDKKPKLKTDGIAYMELLHYIKADEFWNAQVAQIDVAGDGNIRIVPLLGNHIIEFGKPEEIAQKLAKLKIYYRQIMPVAGWDKFSKVKVQYRNQVVCE